MRGLLKYIFLCLMALLLSSPSVARKMDPPKNYPRPALSCANALCTIGHQCVETSTGPQCIKNTDIINPITPPVTAPPIDTPPSNISCANVRCASGSCIETPEGPICVDQAPSCASTTCLVGKKCVETSNGPQCLSDHQQYNPIAPHTPPRHITPPPNYHNHPHYHSHEHTHNHGGIDHNHMKNKHSSHHEYTCPPVKPTNPFPEPKPDPEQIMCPMIYAPVCGEKSVHCVRAPCPSIRRTLSNDCVARAEGYAVIHQGECR